MFGADLVENMAGSGVLGWSAVLAAPFVGSFVGVVIVRLPQRRPIVLARSQCERCGAVLAARDLVPLASWLAARGRCRRCGEALGWFYPAVELAALAVALAALAVDRGAAVWLDCLLGWWLLALGWIDLREWLLPDRLTLPLILAGLAVTAWLDPAALFASALGAALGYLVLRLIAWGYRAWRGQEGLGQGDAKLLAAAGAWLGAWALPQVVLAAAVAGLLAVFGLRLAGVQLGARSAIPFGPFLAFATWLIWLFARCNLG
jgi:leader peptidase (prepilin peptidase)/N-methyltransferase